MDEGLPVSLLECSEAEVSAQFDALQRKLVPLWRSIDHLSEDPQTIVVVPSINVDASIHGVLMQAYEERFLFLLFLLRQPNARVVYVTSHAIHQDVVDYYLDLLPGVISTHAKARLFLLSPLDGSSRPLTEKVLARPQLVARIRSLIPNLDRAHLVPYSTTHLERELAIRLGIPMYGADPRHFHLGTKSGARRVFAEEGVLYPLGRENLKTPADIVDALVDMIETKPAIRQAIVKLNEGVSGEGNATIDLAEVATGTVATRRARVAECVRAMRLEASGMTYDTYMAKLAQRGGIVEERLDGADFRSPSAQLRVTPLGELELLSTHDQLLGGPTGQAYLGCRFPASPDYATAIMREAAKVGRRLAADGVIGRFALDFVAFRNGQGEWEISAIEINLRKGGTTHPFLTLQFLTDGRYDAEAGRFVTPRGEAKYFVATDHLHSPAYRVFTHLDLFDIVARHHLHFDQARQTGVVLHMMNALGERGLVGLTAVANSPEEADELYARTSAAFDAEAAKAGAW
jgi:hypothetical protein